MLIGTDYSIVTHEGTHSSEEVLVKERKRSIILSNLIPP